MRKYWIGGVLATVLFSGCGGLYDGRPAPAMTVDAKVIAAHTRFGFNLFRALRATKPEENLFISPASVSLALSMTYNGARGETEQEMAKALSLQGLDQEEINRETGALQTILANPDPKVELAIANSI